MAICRFDDSLPWLVESLAADVNGEGLERGVVLREASGRLAFFSATELDGVTRERLLKSVGDRIGAYARPDRALACPDEPGAKRVLEDPDARSVEVGEHRVRFLDRRIVGVDWMHPPEPRLVGPPRFVFASLKGGVGRSTAISIVAAEHASRGRNVLVVDLDLEAPGIGSMLLSDDRLPVYGALDFLVEQNLGVISPAEAEGFLGTSGLTEGKGLVDVVPVVGTRSNDEPGNYLAKLSRAMLEGITPGGASVPVRDKIRAMLETFEARRSYDLVLIDVRAGLAELAAGPLLSLGANVFLFGTAQRQTLDGFRYLFSHLQGLAQPEQGSPWQGLKIVHAKATQVKAHELFRDQLWELFSESLYESEEHAGLEGFNFASTDPDAPHNPIAIPLDAAFADWNPIDAPHTLVQAYYGRTFGPLLAFVEDLVA